MSHPFVLVCHSGDRHAGRHLAGSSSYGCCDAVVCVLYFAERCFSAIRARVPMASGNCTITVVPKPA
jgi:hypothetical protein